MKTLVIHPKDSSTDFLKLIYEGRGYTEVNEDISRRNLVTLIKEHDRIIMLGHGDESGMFGHDKYVIYSSEAFYLKEKYIVAIWCNADAFIKKHNLKGVYTSMIISEYEEAILCCLHNFSGKDIEESNTLFARTMSKAIHENFDLSLAEYSSVNNPIIQYNTQRIYKNK